MSTIVDAIVAPFEAAADIAKAIDTVAGILDGGTSAVIILENSTHHALERVADGHEHGGFGVTPSGIVPARSVAVFGSVDTGFLTDIEGWVRYRVKDRLSEETLVGLSWKVPRVGSNDAAGSAYYLGPPLPLTDVAMPIPSSLYRVLAVEGSGKQDAQMRYTLERL